MKQNSNGVTERDLHAYIDGQLDLRRISEVEQFLQCSPSDLRMVHEHMKINRLLQQKQNIALLQSVPDNLKHVKVKTVSDFSSWLTKPMRFVATAAWIAIGIAAGWAFSANNYQQEPFAIQQNFSQQAAFAHAVYTPEKRHPVEVDVKKEHHLFKWLSNRLKNDVKAPPLINHGYELMGGRLLSDEGRPAAQFMYENQAGNRLTLFVRTHAIGNYETLFNYSNHDDINVFYWIDGSVGYALSGTIKKPDLLDIANTVYHSLEHQGKK